METARNVHLEGVRRYDEHGDRWCTACRQYLPVAAFGRNAAIADGLHVYCKACNRQKALAQYRKAPAEWNARRTDLHRRWRQTNPEKVAQHYASATRRRAERRQRVIEHYGGKCACCGEATFGFLSLDHIDGGGNAHRREVGPSDRIYAWVEKNGYPDSFQVLCYNCNLSKGFLGHCPHEDELR